MILPRAIPVTEKSRLRRAGAVSAIFGAIAFTPAWSVAQSAAAADAPPVNTAQETRSASDESAQTPAPQAPAPQAQARDLVEEGIRNEHAEGRILDLARAHDLYCQAALTGYTDAWMRLGWMYANGRGVPRDDSIAHTLFQHAAEQGNDLASRLAAAIQGTQQDKLPDCLVPRVAQAVAPAPPPVDYGPTPVVESPAQFRPGPTSPEFRKLVAGVLHLAGEFQLDPRLVLALIRVESNFDPLARSPRNAQGLMQLLPETAKQFAVADTWNPLQNVRGGMAYLKWLLSYFRGDVVLTVAAYNAGAGAVDKYLGVPPYPETMAYVQRVRALYPMDRHAFDAKLTASFGVSPAVQGRAATASQNVNAKPGSRRAG